MFKIKLLIESDLIRNSELKNHSFLTLHKDVWYRKSAQSRIKLEKAYGLYYNFFVQKKL